MALSGLDQRFAEMKTHTALSGITEADRPLLQGKFSVARQSRRRSNHERRFERVLNIAGMPNPIIGETKLMKSCSRCGTRTSAAPSEIGLRQQIHCQTKN